MTATADAAALTLNVPGTGEFITLDLERLVIAGYTARDQSAVQAHIHELELIGVAPPPQVPMFYEVPVALATTETTIEVDGERTSGEVEPVLIKSGDRLFLGLGSDHTDREVETRDIAESKASAPKPLATEALELGRALADWDKIEVTCRLDGELYQQGSLSAMLTPEDLMSRLASNGGELGSDALMFCGTLPLLAGSFIYGSRYELELRLPDGTSLSHTYLVKRRDR